MHLSQITYSLACAASVFASPIIQGVPVVDAEPHAKLEVRGISKSIDIGKRWQNKKLFEGHVLWQAPKDAKHSGNTGVQKKVGLKLTCVDCWTQGEVGFDLRARRSREDSKDSYDNADDDDDDEEKDGDYDDDYDSDDEDDDEDDDDGDDGDESFVDKVKDVADNLANIDDWFNPVLRIDLSNVEIYAHLKMSVKGELIYQWRLHTWSLHPFIPKGDFLKIGPSISLDLVFLAIAKLDIESGFHIKLPPEAFIEFDVRKGSIVNQLLKGTVTKSLPFKVKVSETLLVVDLRLTAGIDVNPGRSIEAANHRRAIESPSKGEDSVFVPAPVPTVQEHEFQRRDLALRSVFGIGGTTGASVGIGFGIQVFANILEWTANFTIDTKGHSNCSLKATFDFNSNVGIGGYAAALVERKRIGYIPKTSWMILRSEATTKCLVQQLGGGNTPKTNEAYGITATTTAPYAGPTGNDVVVPYVLTTCASPIVNCPESLIGTTTVNNTMDASLATELPQLEAGYGMNDTAEHGWRSNDDEWEVVKWLDLKEPVLLSLPDEPAKASGPFTPTPSSTPSPMPTSTLVRRRRQNQPPMITLNSSP